MSAPMKLTYGSTLNKLMTLRKINFLSAPDACQKCISSQNNRCLKQKYPKSSLYQCKTEKLTLCTSKGSNPFKFKHSLPVCVDIFVLKHLDNSEPVLYTLDYTGKRHYVSTTDSNASNSQAEVTEKLKCGSASKIVKEAKENVWTIPNLLTMARIVLTPVIGFLVVEESYTAALGLFTFAGLTDLLDGYIARNFKNQMSAFGTALDPLADKILITVLTVTLTMAHLLPVPLAVLIIGRDALLIATGFVIRYISLPPPRTIKRYFDITNPTAKLLPSTLSKVNTTLQLLLVCFTLAAPVFNFVDHQALQCLWALTAATTFGSGVGYIITRKKSVQFLQKGSKIAEK